MSKGLWSIFTDELGVCYITKMNVAHIHHVFPGTCRRKICEKYGFVVPLHPALHQWAPDSVHNKPNQGLDLKLKQDCQRYYEEHYGTREEFIKVFGKSYL